MSAKLNALFYNNELLRTLGINGSFSLYLVALIVFPLSTFPQTFKSSSIVISYNKDYSACQSKVGWRVEVPILVSKHP